MSARRATGARRAHGSISTRAPAGANAASGFPGRRWPMARSACAHVDEPPWEPWTPVGEPFTDTNGQTCQNETRACTEPDPNASGYLPPCNGGSYCPSDSESRTVCEEPATCTEATLTWSEWGDCLGGEQTRTLLSCTAGTCPDATCPPDGHTETRSCERCTEATYTTGDWLPDPCEPGSTQTRSTTCTPGSGLCTKATCSDRDPETRDCPTPDCNTPAVCGSDVGACAAGTASEVTTSDTGTAVVDRWTCTPADANCAVQNCNSSTACTSWSETAGAESCVCNGTTRACSRTYSCTAGTCPSSGVCPTAYPITTTTEALNHAACAANPCVPASITPWTAWAIDGSCPGAATQSRSRSCTAGSPGETGTCDWTCAGVSTTETRSYTCPVACVPYSVTQWSKWAIDGTCPDATQERRTRTCTPGSPGAGGTTPCTWSCNNVSVAESRDYTCPPCKTSECTAKSCSNRTGTKVVQDENNPAKCKTVDCEYEKPCKCPDPYDCDAGECASGFEKVDDPDNPGECLTLPCEGPDPECKAGADCTIWSPWSPGEASSVCVGDQVSRYRQCNSGEKACPCPQTTETETKDGTKQPTFTAWSPPASTKCGEFIQTRSVKNGCPVGDHPLARAAMGTNTEWAGWYLTACSGGGYGCFYSDCRLPVKGPFSSELACRNACSARKDPPFEDPLDP